jgi:hypothetical protein
MASVFCYSQFSGYDNKILVRAIVMSTEGALSRVETEAGDPFMIDIKPRILEAGILVAVAAVMALSSQPEDVGAVVLPMVVTLAIQYLK